MNMLSLSVEEFLLHTSAGSSEPGGGAVAAIVGASAAALVSMVGELTIGKKRYRSVEAEVEKLREKAILVMQELQKAAVEDGEAFRAYLRASAMSSDNPAAIRQRSLTLELAAERMTRIPLAIAMHCEEILSLARELAPIGDIRSISDAGVAIQLAHAALQSALLTVDINLPVLRDAEFADLVRKQRSQLAESASDSLRAGIREVSRRISA